MRPITVTVGPLAAANAALLAASQTPTSGTALTLTGSQPDKPRRVLLTFGNEASNRTLVLAGTDVTGQPIGETLSIASGGAATAQSVLDYKTVTSALPLGGGWSAAVTLGTSGVASSPWVALDKWGPAQVALQVDVSGTVNYTVEQTLEDPNDPLLALTPAQITWLSHSVLASQTASKQDNYGYAPAFTRITLNSGSGSVRYTALQAWTPISL